MHPSEDSSARALTVAIAIHVFTQYAALRATEVPIMQPNYIEIAKLFSNDERFTVPLFQRPYVWTREDQWEPLWEDVKGVLERLESREGDAPVASHFLGTIVLEQKPTSTGHLTRREVIDGQQRLTTLQILLKAVEHAIQREQPESVDDNADSWAMEREKIGRLTKNLSAGEERYKVWPTNEDRSPFQEVMESKVDDQDKLKSTRMTDAYLYFRGQVEEYLGESSDLVAVRRLVTGLRDYLKLIVLDLDHGDEPQAIFETLNAHGTPLLPADLIKNWLLWEAGRRRLDVEKLYVEYWNPFDKDHAYWRQSVGTGHAARARVDTYLQNWLTKQTMEPISAKYIYDRFLKYAPKHLNRVSGNLHPTEELMSAIRSDALRFERIDKPTHRTRFDLFLGRLKSLDMVVFHPLLIALLETNEAAPETLDKVSIALESYLVRRMICGMQTRGYSTLSLKLLRALRDDPGANPAQLIKDQLLALEGSDEWPGDSAFQVEWTRRKFYGYFRRERVLMILRALEHHYQTKNAKGEPLMSFDWSQLQIEHILPQSWEEHWPLPKDVSVEDRKYSIQNIGNLTLVSKKLNPTMSNAPWIGRSEKPGKRDHLKKYTNMQLNRRLLEAHDADWSDATIKTRALSLFEDAKTIWPKE